MNKNQPSVIIVGHLGTCCLSASDLLIERLKNIDCGVVVISPEKERGLNINDIPKIEKPISINIQPYERLSHLGEYKDGQANRRERRKQKRKNK